MDARVQKTTGIARAVMSALVVLLVALSCSLPLPQLDLGRTSIPDSVVADLTSIEFAYADDESPDRYGSSEGSYVAIDTTKFFGGDSMEGQENAIVKGGLNLLSFVVTTILIPVGMILSSWRMVYLAIFPLITHTDPLDLMRSGRYKKDSKHTGNPWSNKAKDVEHPIGKLGQTMLGRVDGVLNPGSGSSSGRTNTAVDKSYFNGAYFSTPYTADMTVLAQSCLKTEVKFMLFGWIITFIAWGLIQLVMRLAVLATTTADSVVSNVVS